MELETPSKKCLGCSKEFFLNVIRLNLARTNCRKNYSSEEFSELVEACEGYKKQKKSISKRVYYEKKQKPSEDQDISSISDHSEALKVIKVKCKGCSKKISLNAIKNHLNMKQSCKFQYSQEDMSELEKQCDASKKAKRKKSKKIYDQERKKQKTLKVATEQAEVQGKENVIEIVTTKEKENYDFDEL